MPKIPITLNKLRTGEIKMNKPTLLTAATLSVLCANAGLADPLRLIVTHTAPPLVPNSVMDLAQELGYFAAEGVDVEIIRVQQTPMAIAALQSGEGDMANVGIDAILQINAQMGKSAVAITSPNKALPFVIAAKTSINSAADLTGHSFGIGRLGSLDHSLSGRVLDQTGVAIDDLDLVALGQPTLRAQALAAGQIDATTMSIGTWMSIPDKTGLHILIDQDTYFAAAPVVNKVIATTPEILQNRREDVVGMVRALTKLSRDFSADPVKWANAMAEHAPQLDAGQRLDLANSFVKSWSVNGGMNAAELEFAQNWHYQNPDFADVARLSLADWTDFTIVSDVLDQIGVVETSDIPGS